MKTTYNGNVEDLEILKMEYCIKTAQIWLTFRIKTQRKGSKGEII
jgi:hypothetical protein